MTFFSWPKPNHFLIFFRAPKLSFTKNTSGLPSGPAPSLSSSELPSISSRWAWQDPQPTSHTPPPPTLPDQWPPSLPVTLVWESLSIPTPELPTLALPPSIRDSSVLSEVDKYSVSSLLVLPSLTSWSSSLSSRLAGTTNTSVGLLPLDNQWTTAQQEPTLTSRLHRNKSGPNSRNSNSHTGPLDKVVSTQLVQLTQWLISRLPPSTGANLVLHLSMSKSLPALLLAKIGLSPPLPLKPLLELLKKELLLL